MNDFDIELLLNRIFVGSLFFNFKNELYELKYASNQIKYQSNLIYQNIINEERFDEWIREENIVYYMINAGLWTHQTDSMIKKTEKDIEEHKVNLFKFALSKEKQKPIRKYLNSAKSSLNNILLKKQEFLAHTLEGYALSIKNEYLICNTLYKNNKRVFDNSSNDFKSYSVNECIETIDSPKPLPTACLIASLLPRVSLTLGLNLWSLKNQSQDILVPDPTSRITKNSLARSFRFIFLPTSGWDFFAIHTKGFSKNISS
jgi:hypothetical protein